MPYWIHFLIGAVLLFGGVGIVWYALTASRQVRLTGGQSHDGSSPLAPVEEKGAKASGGAYRRGPHVAKMGRMTLQADDISGLRMEIYEHGPVKIEHWAGKIANNIYIRAGKVQDAHVEDVLKPALKGQYKDIENLEILYPMGWIQVIINPSLMDNLRQDQGLGITDLSEKLRGLVLESLSICLTPAIHANYQPYLSLCEDETVAHTGFDLRFQPLPPGSPEHALDCQAAIGMKSIQAVSTVAGLEETHLRVADKTLDGRAYAPLSERFSQRVVIGPRSWCHLRTTSESFNAVVTIGWRSSSDRRNAGQLQILDYKGSDQLWLELPGYEEKHQCRKGWYIEIPAGEGPHTMAYLWCKRGAVEENIGTLFVANPVPDIGSLPEVVVLEHLDQALNDAQSFGRFIATQIYLASRGKHQAANLIFLDDEAGLDYLNHHGLAQDHDLLPEALLSNDDNLHYRVKLVLAPPQYRLVKEWFGKIATRQGVHDQVMRTLSQTSIYRQVFGEVKSLLMADERRPGLSIDLSVDNLIPRGTVLLRMLPILENVRRREIFGEIRLDDWQNARDISGMSCNSKRNFLIEYPAGNIMMRLSRYPLYGIHAPQITGYIGLSLEDPEDPACRLIVENGSNSELRISLNEVDSGSEVVHLAQAKQVSQPKRLPPDQEMGLAIPPGLGHQIGLEIGGQTLEILIYPDPVPQMNEPEFVPAPGKLDFYGLVLGRRAEVSQWQASSFASLWHKHTSGESFQLEGASRITRQGFLASLIRDQTEREVHFFSSSEATIQEGLSHLRIGAEQSTVSNGKIGLSAQIFENDAPGEVTQYERVPLEQVRHAKVLLTDFFDRYYDQVAQNLPADERLLAIDLLKCHPSDPSDLDRHLYQVKTHANQTQLERGWIFRPGGGVLRVGSGPRLQTIPLDVTKPVVGPLDIHRYFSLDWEGGLRTPLSFAIESHREQVSRYLEDGWYELRKDMVYAPGGNLAAEPKIFAGRDPLFIVTNQLKLTHNAQTVHSGNQLNFDPRELCNYFDKDAYRIGYLPQAKAFTLRSILHPNMGTTPKTVFMVVPSGEQAILGSHALDYVDIPPGRNILVLPGLAFRFSQGPAYYGVTV